MIEDNNWQAILIEAKLAGQRRDLDETAKLFQKAYNISRSFETTDGRRGESAFYLGFARYALKQNSEASKLYEESLHFLTPNAVNAEMYSKVCSILGAIYKEEGELEKSEKYFRDACDLQEQHGLDSSESLAFMAVLLLEQKKYLESATYYERLFEIQKGNAPQSEIIETLRRLALTSHYGEDLASQVKWQKELLKIRGLKTSPPRKTSPIARGNFKPIDWGYDTLTNFVDAAQCNEFGNFAEYPEICKAVTETDERFRSTGENLAIPIGKLLGERKATEEFSNLEIAKAEWLEIYFFLRCHATFLSAARSALAAQIPETYMHLRVALEYAMYAFFVNCDDQRKQVWLNRQTDRKAVKKMFHPSIMIDEITAKDQAIGAKVLALYEIAIDDGAHPNVQSYLKSTFQINADRIIRLGIAYLDPSHANTALQQVKVVGEVCLEVFGLIFPFLIE